MACCFVDLYVPRRYATQERHINVLFYSIHSGEQYSEAVVMKHAFGQDTILNVMRLQEVLYSG
jgi:hypothetical protein